jgi:hypothetical protein
MHAIICILIAAVFATSMAMFAMANTVSGAIFAFVVTALLVSLVRALVRRTFD